MTIRQENTLSMYLAVQEYLTLNKANTALLPGYSTLFSQLQDHILQINTVREQQEANKTGHAELKYTLRTKLVSLAADVSRKVVAFASQSDDFPLLTAARYSQSSLKKRADTILCDACNVISTSAHNHAASLVKYGISPAALTALSSAITTFQDSIPDPRLSIAYNKRVTNQLAELIRSSSDNLNKIDSLIEVVRTSDPLFYKTYKNIRIIVRSGTGKLALIAKVIDEENGKPLKHATVKITPNGAMLDQNLKDTDESDCIIKRSASKGGFKIKSLPEGNYSVRASRPGYHDSVATLLISHGIGSILKINLKKKEASFE
jgi:hypothetical protein